ncbi:class I SAM-dependent methyltransferase [Stratiformator vulcanicus]|uniref:Putative methyltransferase YcgJ n=1 Tax=Stratiformator vulcanicus TaxID=2527980 RepID=A0A517R0N8_9PLAN|nr:methyltransferase domain-containing protein [Stratiformator vulcanicus]QDT37431.1 putative methyltransferase YcgJ [Stratiformator vulcanicus]
MFVKYVRERTDLFDGRPKRLLHVAPESHIAAILKGVPNIDYLSADLDSPHAMVKMDITQIEFPDNSFDIIYCSHVLEHVTEDRQAMREFRRVLKSDGWAILQVPITADITDEDPSVTDPDERLKRFGQHDHVRRYGPDYADRLAESGFDVTVDDWGSQLSPATVKKYGIAPEELIYFCRKG